MAVEIIKSYSSRTNTSRVGYKNTSNNSVARSTSLIKWIGIHGTGGGGDNDKNFLDYIYSTSYSASFHYFIGFTGKIYEVVPPERWSRVAGWEDDSPTNPHEKGAIHIECLNMHSNNGNAFSANIIDSLFGLILELLKTYPTITGIAGHGAGLANRDGIKYKVCPGPLFPWDDLRTFLTDRTYTYQTKDVPFQQKMIGRKPITPYVSGVAFKEIIYDLVIGDPDAPVSDSDEKTEIEIIEENATDYNHVNDGNENVNADIFSDDPLIEPVGLLPVAVLGCTLVVAGGTVTFSAPPTTTSLADGKGIYTHGAIITGTVSGNPYSSTMSTTATKTLADGKAVLRVGDQSADSLVTITNAGQTKVLAN